MQGYEYGPYCFGHLVAKMCFLSVRRGESFRGRA